MAKLRINGSGSLVTEVTVKESDTYSDFAYIKFDKSIVPENIRGCSEMFITPEQLELLGKFFIRQAEEIRQEKKSRELSPAKQLP